MVPEGREWLIGRQPPDQVLSYLLRQRVDEIGFHIFITRALAAGVDVLANVILKFEDSIRDVFDLGDWRLTLHCLSQLLESDASALLYILGYGPPGIETVESISTLEWRAATNFHARV